MQGRRAIVIAGVAAAIIAILFVVFLVLPKLGEVSTAEQELEEAQAQQTTLSSRLAALQQARDEAPQNQATIQRVEQQLPPTADLPGMILLLRNAASSAGVQVLSLTPAPPITSDEGTFSSISVSATGAGSYFSVVDYLYSIETLPRAATVESVDLSPQEGTLSFTATVTLYTSDVSSGPGSEPGPTEQGTVPEA
ncbi:MAG TPA: type 4a pilus biogenesis protein PilO [Actinomycetota bacterium]